MTTSRVRPMAHRTGRRERLARPFPRLVRAFAGHASLGLARVLPGRPRGLALAAALVVGAAGVVLLAGPAGHDQAALAAMPTALTAGDARPSTPPVAASALDSATGSVGIEPLDLIGKGVVVAALLYLTLRALRRIQAGPAAGSRQLQVLETRPLGPKASLHLVAVGERRLVVGLTPGGIVAIAELDAAELVEPAVAGEGSPFAAANGRAPQPTVAAPADLRTLAVAGWFAVRQMVSSRTIPRFDHAIAAAARPRTDR